MSAADFDVLNREFAARTQQPEIFDCGPFNLVKIYQHAVAATIGQKAPAARVLFDKSALWRFAVKQYRRLKNKNRKPVLSRFNSLAQRPYLLYTGGNYVLNEQGQLISANAYLLRQVLDAEKCCFIHSNTRGDATLGQQADITELKAALELQPDEPELKTLISDVRQLTLKLRNKLPYSEWQHFCAFGQVFVDSTNAWLKILKKVRPKKVFAICHYHNEGLMAAARLLNIETVELQHGLISPEDYYYVYHPAITRVQERALFASRILVFGTYWKQVLASGAGYAPSQVGVIGQYQYHPPVNETQKTSFIERHKLEGKKIIFVGLQKQLTEFFAQYISQLSERLRHAHPDWHLVAKPHPLQQRMHLLVPCGQLTNVLLTDRYENLALLLSISKAQITVYSTTLYDALPFGLVNLSLQDFEPRAAYARRMVQEGIAMPITTTDDPVAIITQPHIRSKHVEASQLYAPFDREFYLH